jgi:hypothetical protein
MTGNAPHPVAVEAILTDDSSGNIPAHSPTSLPPRIAGVPKIAARLQAGLGWGSRDNRMLSCTFGSREKALTLSQLRAGTGSPLFSVFSENLAGHLALAPPI